MRRGNEVIRPESVNTHRECRLGKWYYGAAQERCGHVSAFRSIDAPHAKLHELARRMAEYHQAGRAEERDRLYGELEGISAEIVTHLQAVKQQTTGGAGLAAPGPALIART
ncbi:hypothetical protein D3C86_1760740 [compost metagenome]